MNKNQNTPNESPFELALADLRGQLRGVNLYWLADKARLSRATVENFVSGKTKSPHHRTIFDIEVALGLRRMSPAAKKSRVVSVQNELAAMVVPAKAQSIAVRQSRTKKWTHVRTTTRAFAALQRRRMR